MAERGVSLLQKRLPGWHILSVMAANALLDTQHLLAIISQTMR